MRSFREIGGLWWITAFLFAAIGCGPKAACETLDWQACEEADHCEPTHEESDEPGHPGFSCLPRDRR